MSAHTPKTSARASRDEFGSTRWSVVHDAIGSSSARAEEALSELCRTYWFPLYCYCRRRVSDVDEAQDLTQAFFVRLLERDFIAQVDPARGSFRAFLLTLFKHFLSNEWARRRAQKRGGGTNVISLDWSAAEQRLSLAAAHDETPERCYDRCWAESLIEQVMRLLRTEWVQSGRAETFDVLCVFIGGSGTETSYEGAAEQLGMTAGAARVATHRLRRRYRDLLRQTIAETVNCQDEVDDEIRELFAALTR